MNKIEVEKILLTLYFEFENKLQKTRGELSSAQQDLKDSSMIKAVSYGDTGGSASHSSKSAYQVRQERVFSLQDDIEGFKKKLESIDNTFKVKTRIKELNAHEKDLIYLKFKKNKSTRDIGNMYKCSHVNVQKEIDKAIEKMVEYGN